MSFRCIKAFMHAFSGRFSRTCLEGISFNFFVCFIFNVSLGSAPKRKNFDIQCNTRVASGGQFTLNYHTPSHNETRPRDYCLCLNGTVPDLCASMHKATRSPNPLGAHFNSMQTTFHHHCIYLQPKKAQNPKAQSS